MPDMGVAPEMQPIATPAQPEMATPDAFGANVWNAIGKGAEQIDDAMMRARQIDLQNQYDADLGQAQIKVAGLRDKADEAARALQTQSGLDPSQYHDAVMGQYDRLSAGFGDDIANPRIARMVQSQLAEMRVGISEKARAWQQVRTAGDAVGNLKVLRGTLSGQTFKMDDPAEVAAAQMQWAETVHSTEGLLPEQRDALVNSGIADLALQFGYGVADRNPAAARKLFNDGWFESHGVGGDHLRLLDRSIDTAEHKQDAQIKAQRHVEELATVEAARGLIRQIEAGGSVPLPQLLAAEHAVRALGGEYGELADRLKEAAVGADVNARYGAMQPQAVMQMAQGEAAKVEAARKAGKPVTLEEGARAKAMMQLAATMGEKAASDPWALAANIGITPTPIDFNSPNIAQLLGTRVQQSRILAQRLGPGYAPQPLQKPEAEQLRTMLSTGSAIEQLHMMQAIAAQEAHAPGATAAIFNQVKMPPEFRLGTALMTGANPQGAQVASDMLNGYHALQKMPALVPEKAFTDDATRYVQAAFGGNLSALAGNPQIEGVVAAARAIYANDASRRGFDPNGALDQKLVQQSINRALGAYIDGRGQQRGGIGDYHGAVILPDGVSQKDFSTKATMQLPNALIAAGVKLATYRRETWHLDTAIGDFGRPADAAQQIGRDVSLLTLQKLHPREAGESTWAYSQRIGNLQAANVARRNQTDVGSLPAGTQLHAVGDGQYKMWTGSGYLTDGKGRAAVWDYRSGKVHY